MLPSGLNLSVQVASATAPATFRRKTLNVPMPTPTLTRIVLAVCLAVAASRCSRPDAAHEAAKPQSPPPAATTTQAEQLPPPAAVDDNSSQQSLPDVPSPYDALPPAARAKLGEKFTGDLDAMVARRMVRVGVAYSRTHYFIDRGVQRGLAYESLKLFEEQLNKRLNTGDLKVHVVFVTMPRDQLLPALAAGNVDLAAATLTITPARLRLVNFSQPTRSDVAELAVTRSDVTLHTPDDLSGREVFVRRSSSYYETLQALNARLQASGKPPVHIRVAPEVFEDDDLLEMVNAGLVQATVVHDYLGEFWQKVFPDIRLQREAALSTGGSIGVAVRKNNPKMLRAVNIWINEYGPRTAFGNIMERRYLQDTRYAKSATSEAERRKFRALIELFRKYGTQYDVDYLLMAAQGYQESQLDHSARSRVGAVGVMQVMPATGRELGVGDIRQIEPNVHAGVKYIRSLMDRHFNDPGISRLNKGLMAFAAYNAGPARVQQLRREAATRGLDPNVWFGSVERIASERIGRETVQYVSNIYKYYVAYKLAMEEIEERSRVTPSPTSP